jgi:hypothetical protein
MNGAILIAPFFFAQPFSLFVSALPPVADMGKSPRPFHGDRHKHNYGRPGLTLYCQEHIL